MTDEVKAQETYDQNRSGPPVLPGSGRAAAAPTAEERLAGNLPPQERNQPDPAMQLSGGRVGGGAITLVAVLCAIIVGVVLWGLNSPAPSEQNVETAASDSTHPPGPGTSGAGTTNPRPSNNAKGGKG